MLFFWGKLLRDEVTAKLVLEGSERQPFVFQVGFNALGFRSQRLPDASMTQTSLLK